MDNEKKQLTELELIRTVENIYPLLKEQFEETKKITINANHFAGVDFILADILKLGMVVKYAELYKKEVNIIYKNDKKRGNATKKVSKLQ